MQSASAGVRDRAGQATTASEHVPEICRRWAEATFAFEPLEDGVGLRCAAARQLHVQQPRHLRDGCEARRAVTDTNGCTSASLTLNTPVTVTGASRPGKLAYNSWLSMQAAGTTDDETCQYNDLALIKLDPADVANTNPSIPTWGGPTGVGTAAALDDIYSYGNSELRQGITQLSPKRGKVIETSAGGWSYSLYTITPGIPGDSGSAFLNADGQALGILSTVALAPLPLSNGVGDIGREIAYARAHGFPDLTLVDGTEPFEGGLGLQRRRPPPQPQVI